MTDHQVNEMVNAWRATGVDITPQEIGDPKPALYLFSKILLNSLWGKLCQRNYNSSTKFVTESDEVLKLLSDSSVEVSRVEDAGPGRLLMSFMRKNDLAIESHSLHNPFIGFRLSFSITPIHHNTQSIPASLVTSYGRAKLYRTLLIVNRRAIYCDTVWYRYIQWRVYGDGEGDFGPST